MWHNSNDLCQMKEQKIAVFDMKPPHSSQIISTLDSVELHEPLSLPSLPVVTLPSSQSKKLHSDVMNRTIMWKGTSAKKNVKNVLVDDRVFKSVKREKICYPYSDRPLASREINLIDSQQEEKTEIRNTNLYGNDEFTVCITMQDNTTDLLKLEIDINETDKDFLKLNFNSLKGGEATTLDEQIIPDKNKLLHTDSSKLSNNETTANVKRKNSREDKGVKRRRIYGVASKQVDDVDYNEDMGVLSLNRKNPVRKEMVNFFIDLLAWNRKKRLEQIKDFLSSNSVCVENIGMDDLLEDLDFFKENAFKSMDKEGVINEKGVCYTIPGLDYKVAGGNCLPSFQHCQEKEHSLPKSLEAGNDMQLKAVDNYDGREGTSSKTVFMADETIKAVSLKEEEDISPRETNRIKGLEITMDVFPEHFERQSDVTSISKEVLQKALNSASYTEVDHSFKNLKYKIVARSPSKQNDVNNKCDKARFNKMGKKHITLGNSQVTLLRGMTWLEEEELPYPQIDFSSLHRLFEVFYVPDFEPLMIIIDQIANGTPPTPHVSMRYELLRFCTLRSYPKENKPYLIKLAAAGFYYASDGDGVVCYCCGVRRYNWVSEDNPMKIHQRINPNCKFLKKNEENNIPVKYFGPYSKSLMFIDTIPEPVERPELNEDVNNDWAPERIRSPASTPQSTGRQNESGANALGINTAIPKHTQYATKTAREASYNGWSDTASHTPQELSDAGFFYAGFGDCVRCFYCGIGLRHWTKDDNPWIEHARWSRNCVYVKQKKGEEFVNLVQLAIQYSQDNESGQSSNSGNQLPAQDIERILLSDAAQSVLEMGYQPRIIKKAIDQILRQNGDAKITAQILMEKVLEIEETEAGTQANPRPAAAAAATTAAVSTETAKPPAQSAKPTTNSAKPTINIKSEAPKEGAEAAAKSDVKQKENEAEATKTTQKKPESKEISDDEAKSQDPKAIKAENEQLKEQTLCKVCLDNTVCIVFLPCGHLVTCADCAPAMRKCPICRALVKGTVRTYMS